LRRIVAIFRASRKGPFVLVAGRLQSEPDLALSAPKCLVLLRIWAVPPHQVGLPRDERAKTELKGLMPEDAKEAFGHGVRAKRSKAGRSASR
jgi:hypothetical protein